MRFNLLTQCHIVPKCFSVYVLLINKYSLPHNHSVTSKIRIFTWWILLVVPIMFFMVEGFSSESNIVFTCHVFLVVFNLEGFLRFTLTFISLTLLKIPSYNFREWPSLCIWCLLVIRFRVGVFDRTLTEMMLFSHCILSDDTWLICLIIDIYFNKVMSDGFLHCKKVRFPPL